ncbi:MAG: hypothetical protein V4787_14965 [Pseudomonadota bacterium]
MSLKLFRSTGYSSLLSPGRSRETLHPAWVVGAASFWAGIVCNVPLWRALAGVSGNVGLPHALLVSVMIASGYGIALSLFGWRATLKPAASLVLIVAALVAVARWNEPAAVPAAAIDAHLAHSLLPSWASLLHWQAPALLAVLAIAPMVWVWNAPVKRLPGPQQLRANLRGMATAAIPFGIAAVLLFGVRV